MTPLIRISTRPTTAAAKSIFSCLWINRFWWIHVAVLGVEWFFKSDVKTVVVTIIRVSVARGVANLRSCISCSAKNSPFNLVSAFFEGISCNLASSALATRHRQWPERLTWLLWCCYHEWPAEQLVVIPSLRGRPRGTQQSHFGRCDRLHFVW